MAVLLLLQQREQVTAAEVAEELEVSERTARRDLDALGVAGLPIYSIQGRNGGWRLLGGGRTDLSGLTAPEARALFLVAGPASTATPEVRTALRKLLQALPEPFRAEAEAASGAVLVDADGWDTSTQTLPPPPPLLDTVQHAVIEGQQLHLTYVARDGVATTRTIHPLGLAAKGRRWYLVADTERGLRTFRVDRMQEASATGDTIVRPPDFDLATAWELITGEVDELRAPVRVRALVHRDVLGWCRGTFGTRLQIGPPTPDGRVEVEIRGHHIRSLAAELAGFGDSVEVAEPAELRTELAQIGVALVATYPEDQT